MSATQPDGLTVQAGLTVRALRAGYGAVGVLNDVSLDVGAGEIVGLAGLNGAGKTTTLRAISGVIPRSAGTVLLNGQPVPAHANASARRGLGHVPEGRRLFGNLTVAENLRYGSVAGATSNVHHRRIVVLDAFPCLTELLGRRAGHLSGGEQQMLAIARGLMACPRLLMVDELSLGLSPKAAKEISSALLTFARREGLALLLVDQNIALLSSTCDRLYVLRDGSTKSLSTTTETQALEDAYF